MKKLTVYFVVNVCASDIRLAGCETHRLGYVNQIASRDSWRHVTWL